MKHLILSAFIALSLIGFIACKKSGTTSSPGYCGVINPSLPDSFSFGRAHGFCDSGCAKFFLTITAGSDSGRLYPDSMSRYIGSTLFKHSPLSATEYGLALALAQQLRLLPEATCIGDTVYGAPDSHDQGGLYISFKINNVRHNWIVDMDTIAQPAALRPYFNQVNSVIDALP